MEGWYRGGWWWWGGSKNAEKGNDGGEDEAENVEGGCGWDGGR